MKIKAQFGMVMNLDKCIGCHTCSVTCNNTWTNRTGAEYMWWNNVETKPGVGYPREWENQETQRGGWELKNGKIELKAGGRAKKLLNIFYNPDLTRIDDYYEPWTYDYENLIKSPQKKHQPVARPISQLTGEYIDLKWGPNWEDDLAGVYETAQKDPNMHNVDEQVIQEYEQAFMMYLPRICEHCINPSCLSSCPSGAIYKRDEDGIVLVDEDSCRSWRFCMSGCPYKKVYFNWKTNKAEKCTFCFPRIENGQPTVCSETCVGRLRYIGIVLYDADKIEEAASVENPQDLYESHVDLFLDPKDPEVVRQAKKDGIPEDWIEAAQASPVYKLAVEYKVALPLHPEYRTLPMVWYIPPLSPITNTFGGQIDTLDPKIIFPTIKQFRIPIQYLANLMSAGDTKVIERVLKKMVAMRSYMRSVNLKQSFDQAILKDAGLTEETAVELYELSAIAKYNDRYVIPKSHREEAGNMYSGQGSAGYDFMEGCSGCSLGTEKYEDLYAFSEEYWSDLNGNAMDGRK
ncbi:nitrate reductase subunit beta [Bacillus sonorensis]|uniref:Nitrate reductase subunit beta n=2 Tax=Bacillus sonorensis TaxID=119858 RepID=M5P8H1_9BACI|nr:MULTISPECIES: nitrate reductase subunit beta [Bacillus]ASB89046.1 Nitrate reductase [Bacillus sonorensis]EME75729.1 nitrate reductase subunit beta [Bacillus sonorensis L12]MBG9915015.1 nitrate reductase [Bacillus sonorensis]MCF7618394.1 nitrate reductase subunit beta [Bacillus sonorensis]MCY7859371.1 nitrate reductase subunit beta [Bacillus sonorensis]